MIKRIARPVVHLITGTRRFYYRKLEHVGSTSAGLRVLEIGSGKQVKGEDSYSAIHLFPDAAEFRQTDFNAEFGHEVVDVTAMDIDGAYDVILCLNVLEHVYEAGLAVANLHRALAPGGTLHVAVPFMFPLHDEPHDYWRFTEHALRRLFSDFGDVQVDVKGSRVLPFGLFVSARR